MNSIFPNIAPLSFRQFARINGKVVRFYAPAEMPDLPWVSWSDIVVAAGFPRSNRRQMTAKLVGDWGHSISTVETDIGTTYVIPHGMAQGLIQVALEAGFARSSLEDGYVDASAKAMQAMLSDLPAQSRLEYALAAMA